MGQFFLIRTASDHGFVWVISLNEAFFLHFIEQNKGIKYV